MTGECASKDNNQRYKNVRDPLEKVIASSKRSKSKDWNLISVLSNSVKK